jgi:DNA-binding transcriptional regulator YdaS (Cro superfamily)
MKLADYLSAHGAQTELARAVGAQPQLVWQWSRGVRKIPIERCMPIERATNGAVTRRDLRPDDWQEIWPELATTNPSTEPAAAGV